MRPGDGIDNDCDGHTDEEENAYDGLDNDGDFRFDEDVDSEDSMPIPYTRL